MKEYSRPNEMSRNMRMLIEESIHELTDEDGFVPLNGMSNHYIGFTKEPQGDGYRFLMTTEVEGKKLHVFFKR